jgi:hypothetical protein
MRTNLRLVERAIDCPSEVLPTPGGADEAQDRRLELVHALLHREVLDDALLHLLEAVVVGVEHLDRVGEVAADLALLAPRQAEQRVDVVAHDRRFRGHRRHHAQLLQLRHRLRLGLARHLRGLDLFLHLLEIGVLVALSELLLDRLDLLVQVILALALLHLPLDASADALLDLQDVDLALEHAEQVLEALADVAHLEDLLLLLELERQMRGDRIREAPAIVDAGHRRQDFRRNLLVQLDVLVELGEQRPAHRLDFVRGAGLARNRLRMRGQVFGPLLDRADARALRSFDEHLHRSVRQLQHLQHRRDAADVVEIGRHGIVLRRLFLRDEQDVLAGVHRDVERLDGFRAAHEQRDHHVRKHDDVAQRQKRQRRDVGGKGGVVGHACLGEGYHGQNGASDRVCQANRVPAVAPGRSSGFTNGANGVPERGLPRFGHAAPRTIPATWRRRRLSGCR